MKLRCKHCHGRLGLGVISMRVYVPERWWISVYRFCARKCREDFLTARNAERERKRTISALFQPP